MSAASRTGIVHICSFEAVEHLRESTLAYEELKAAVLRAGRFSVFEASATSKRARLFTRLCSDPEIITDKDSVGFPWTLVRSRRGRDKVMTR